MTIANTIGTDTGQTSQPLTASNKKSKKASTRKSDEAAPKPEPETPKHTPKAVREPTRAESTSEDDRPLGRDAYDDDAEDGFPQSLRETRDNLLRHSRLPPELTALRSLHGYSSGMSQRLRDILNNLRQKGEPSIQMITLQELSDLLLISNEDNLSGHFSPDAFIKELTSLMQPEDFAEANPEMMLLACRCIANMMEALPASTPVVVYGGAVPVLCQKLLEIDFIDLAEQALSTLEKISVDYPGAIVREGGLSACLNFLDFFATSTQRTAVTTAANCCKNISQDSFPVIHDVMPTLLNVLSNSDQKVVEQGSICVCRIIESFKYDHERLEQLVSVDLLKAIRRLLQPGTTNLIGPNIHTQFLRVLSFAARASPRLSAELLKMDIVDTLYQILTGVSPPNATDDVASQIDSVFIMQALIHRPREQITETLNVICEVLPPMRINELSFDESFIRKSLMPNTCFQFSSSKSKGEEDENADALKECHEEIKRFAIVMFPTLTDAFSSTVNLGVRQRVLAAQLKMLSNLDTNILEEALRSVPYASFLASILSQQDHPSLVSAAIQAADILLNRLIQVYGYQFYREGVMAEVMAIAEERTKVPKKTTVVMDSEADRPIHVANSELKDNIASEPEGVDIESVLDQDIHSSGSGDDDDEGDENDEADPQNDIHEDSSQSPSESSSDQDSLASPPPTDLEINISAAKRFLEVHENVHAKPMKDNASKILTQLRSLTKLVSDHYLKDGSGSGLELFSELSRNFQGDALSTITSAELLQSDIVDTLLEIFSNPSETSRMTARANFLQVFMTLPTSPTAANSTTPFNVFIHKLQDLLSREEHFEVVTVHHNAFDNSRSSPYSMLSRQLRLKLVSEDESDVPRSYHSLTISVHAIATFRSQDEYLRPRIILAERPRTSRHREGMASTLAAFAAVAGIPSPHHRLAERIGGPDGSPMQSSSPEGPSSTKRIRKTHRSNKDEITNETTPKNSNQEPLSRPTRRKKDVASSSQDQPIPPPERTQTPLECADERQLSDEDEDVADTSALDAIVDDLDDSVDGDAVPEPGAVNMEVAATGKVTARKEDGTRVATPSHAMSMLPPHLQRTPSSHQREFMPQVGFPSASRAMSYAAAMQSVPQDWHVEFSVDGRPAPHHATVYRAVHHDDLQATQPPSRSIWSTVHTVKFKRVQGPPPAESPLASRRPSMSSKEDSTTSLPESLHKNPQTSKILRLLNIFHEMNANLDDVMDDNDKSTSLKAATLAQFVNTKLTAKLNRQLEEPLIVASKCLPSWSEDLARLYPFLFPFETRVLFLQSTSFGYNRSMQRWQSQSTEDTRRDRHREDRPYTGKLQRQKVRIQRSRILDSACKVMEIYGGSASLLEIEYFDEVGTGLGPTLEFYSTVSKEFSKKKTNMWRASDANDNDKYAFGKNGMFPAPMTEAYAEGESGKKILHYFKMLGKFVARSMLDSRIIDVSLNPIFFRVSHDSHTVPLSLGAIRCVDEQLANSLKSLKQYANATKGIRGRRRLSANQKSKEMQKFSINETSIEDLSLDFTLPGYPHIELQKDGGNVAVTMENVATYIDKVVDMTIGSGIQRQVDHFRAGFSEVFPYSALSAFTPTELVNLFGRVEEDWSLESKQLIPLSFHEC